MEYLIKSTKKSGFTIMEMVLYMGLLMILLAILSQLFSSSLESQLASQSYSNVNQDGTFIINRLTYDIQGASSVSTPANLGDISTTLAMTVNGVSYSYSLTNGNLLLNGAQLNGFNTTVSNLSFQKLGNTNGKPTIKLSFTLTSKVRKQDSTYDSNNYATTISLR